MRTNVKLYFHADGAKPTEVMAKVKSVGFKVSVGRFDVYYDWGKEVAEAEIMGLADKVKNALNGTKATFIIETNKYQE